MPVRLCAHSVMMRGINGSCLIYNTCAIRWIAIASRAG